MYVFSLISISLLAVEDQTYIARFSSSKTKKHFKMSPAKNFPSSAARFRSEDIRVMSPARFRCATALKLADCIIAPWRTGLKFRPLRGLGVGNIVYIIRLIQKYMVIGVLLCGLGSLVSE